MNGRNRFLGVVVPPLYLQEEGVDGVLDLLGEVNVDAICIEPTVARVVAAPAGVRFPDLHLDGHQRVLDRPIRGARELQVEYFAAWVPTDDHYAGGPYRPRTRPVNPPHPELLAETIAGATARGIGVHLQLSPLAPAGLRIEDTPVCVDGRSISEPRVANTGCPNSPALGAYCRGLITDILKRHDSVCGLFLDWAEFPAYGLAELFTCFCPHCEEAARSLGLDWQHVRADVGGIWSRLHRLDARDCRRIRRLIERPSALVELLMRYPGCLDFARFKAMSVVRLYESVASVLREIGREDVVIGARGWAPPWNRASGMDYRALAATCAVVAPKLFTFDYAAVPRWYGQTLKDWNPAVPEEELVDTLLDVLDLSRLPGYERLDAYQIPSPHEQHPLDDEAYERRIIEVVDQVGGNARVIPITHAYGPLDQWKRAVAIAQDTAAEGMWVQMYGYLSQDKLEVLHAVWR